MTRAKQIVERLGGRIDPKEGYENDVCIYLLGAHRNDGCPEVEHAYYDVMDCGRARLSRIRSRTTGGIIAVSLAQYNEFKETSSRDLYFIPHHHCNFERQTRPSERPVRRVGCCGGDSAIQWPHDRVKAWLAQYGLEFVFTNEYLHRERVCAFYADLDIQIVFRPTHSRGIAAHTSPLKVSNAGSFGIPTVAYPEIAFTPEWNGNSIIYADNMGDVMRQVQRLAEDPTWYAERAGRAQERAEAYHIDNVIPFYRDLPGAA